MAPGSFDDLATWTGSILRHDGKWRLFYMFVTARANAGPADGRGVIGHAWSADLLAWEVGPPVSAPGEFAALEVPQLVRVEAAWWILFSALAPDHSTARLRRLGVHAEGGTHYLRSAHRLGPYALERDRFLVGDPRGSHYAGRTLRRDGRWYFFAWRAYDDGDAFVGALTDPVPVMVENGRASVRMP